MKTWLAVLALITVDAASEAQQPAGGPACASADYGKLDFWVGDWTVASASGEAEGTNHIEKILGGCAIQENWKDVEGHEGKSLFYFQPVLKIWKQVWVTDQGPIKEKTLLAAYAGPGVRFQGELPRKDGSGTYLDRTTLVPGERGTVRQIIEISLDGGKTWDAKYTWEGIYTPVKR